MPPDAPRNSAVLAQLDLIQGVSWGDAFDLSTQEYCYLADRKAAAWGADVSVGGFVAHSSPPDGALCAAAMVWGKSDGKTQINMAALCAAPLRKAQVDVGVLSGFGLSESVVVLGSDGLLQIPANVLPPSDDLNAKLRSWTMAGEARVEAPELPDDPDLWTGVYFTGLLSPMVGQTSAGEMDAFFKWLRLASLRVKGLLVADREDSVAVSLSWTPRADEYVTLPLGSNPNWSVSLTGATLKGRIGGAESTLDLLTVHGSITIDNYKTNVAVTFRFDEKTISLIAQPEWGVSLAWLKSLGGEQSFTDGGGDILVRHTPASGAAPALKIKSLEVSLGYGGGFAVQRLAVTVATMGAWDILHGKLDAEVGVSLLFARNVTFTAALEGKFVWRDLALSARLDTACGTFMARYEDETEGTQAFLTRHLSPDPAAATVAPTAQTRLQVDNLRLAVAEVYGNYKESSFGVALETTGAIDFTINGNVKLVISALQASGELSTADGEREWSLALSASVNLVEESGGTRAPLLGRGATLTGAVGSHELKFGLHIDKIQFAKIIPSLFSCPCPELLKDASLEGLALSYDRARGFSFQTGGELPLGDTLSLTALKFSIAGSGAIAFVASADFRWKGAADKMTATLTGRGGEWSLSAHAAHVNVGRLINAVGNSDVKGDISATDVSVTMAFGGDGVALSLAFNTAFGSNAVKMGLYAFRKSSGAAGWQVLFFGSLTLAGKALPLGGNLLAANQISINLALRYLKGEKKAIAAAFGASAETNAARKALDSLPDTIAEGFTLDKPEIRGAAVAAAANAPQGSGGGAAPAELAPAEPAAAADADGLTWSTLNKRFGPLSIDRIGYGAVKQEAGGASAQTGRLSVDGGLNLGPLKFTLLGLGVDATFPSFTITPRLEGLGLNVKRGPVSISGSLLVSNGVYAGSAQVTTAKFSLGAVGRLDLTRGRPSFFLYCVAAASLGGPPAFFVRGLAGGMGYDTKLILPDVKKVKDFPLLTAIQTGNLDTRGFNAVVQPAADSLWFAAGVRFSTFAMMESSVVVTLSLGAKAEIDLFGLSEITVPPLPPGSPGVIAKITIAIRGKLDTERSEAWIRGQIVPGSFVFDPGCRLSGEFGFKVWFGGGRKGDFYATVGGFHPAFPPLPLYDKFERLRLEWRPSNELSIRGSAYLAITSRAIMAGGDLDVLYRDGRVSASFLAGAHFLASWEPFHYSAEVYVSVDAQWRTFWDDTWTYHVGAMVRMEGPPLHGVAYIDLPVITLKVEFGSKALAKPPPLDWPTFRQRLLPETILAVRASGFTQPKSTGMRKIAVALRLGQSCLIEVETAVPVMELETPQPLGGLKLRKPLKKDDVAIPAMSGKLTQSKLCVTAVAASDWAELGSAVSIDVKQTDTGTSPSVWRIGPKPPGGGRSDAELLKQGVGPEVCNGLTIALSFPEKRLTQPVGKAPASAKEQRLAFIAPAPAAWSKSKAGPWPAKPISAGGEGREAKP